MVVNNHNYNLRKRISLIAWVAVPITIIFGFSFPYLGFVVPVVMLTGIIGGIFKGRFVCGWLCPRGAFFDRLISRISPHKPIPKIFRNSYFRWLVFALLMGFMAFQISLDPKNIEHWGVVFVRICAITTVIGVVVAIIYHPRTWCSFCPMGTLQGFVGGHKDTLKIKDGCIECGICERKCPIDLKIVGEFKNGTFKSKDCLRCNECVDACPKKVLFF